MEDRDQRHKGREVILGLLLAGVNLAGTSFALERTIQDHSGAFAMLCPVFQCFTVMLKQKQLRADDLPIILDISVAIFLAPSLFHLAGCGFLFLFWSTAHPWRHLANLQETREEVKAENTV